MAQFKNLIINSNPKDLIIIAPSVIEENVPFNLRIIFPENMGEEVEGSYVNDDLQIMYLSLDKISETELRGDVTLPDVTKSESVIITIEAKSILEKRVKDKYQIKEVDGMIGYQIQDPIIDTDVVSSNKPQDVAELISSVFTVVKDHYLSFFDPEYFKTVRVKSHLEGITDFKAFMMSVPQLKLKPLIVFDPDDLEIVEDSIFSDVDLMRNPMVKDGLSGSPIYSVPFIDLSDMVDNKVLGLLYRINRYRLQTNILMVTSNRATQLNLYNHLLMNIRHRTMYTLTSKISCRLDNAHIFNIAKILKMDYKSEEFMDALNRRSLHPIRRIFRPNNQVAFYIYTDLNFYINVPNNPSMDTVSKNGMIEESGLISATILTEVDIPASYQLIVSESIIKDPIPSIISPTSPVYISPPIEDLRIPTVFSDMLLMMTIDSMIDDVSDSNNLSLADLFEEKFFSLVEFLKIKFAEGTLNDYLIVNVYENGKGIYTHIEDFNLIIPEPKAALYTLAVYINYSRINKEANDSLKKVIGTLKFDM